MGKCSVFKMTMKLITYSTHLSAMERVVLKNLKRFNKLCAKYSCFN